MSESQVRRGEVLDVKLNLITTVVAVPYRHAATFFDLGRDCKTIRNRTVLRQDTEGDLRQRDAGPARKIGE